MWARLLGCYRELEGARGGLFEGWRHLFPGGPASVGSGTSRANSCIEPNASLQAPSAGCILVRSWGRGDLMT